MDWPIFHQPLRRASATGILMVVAVICAIVVVLLTWPRAWQFLKTSQFPQKEYYPAPISASTANPGLIIIPTPVGERPEWFPASLPFYSSDRIAQSYRAIRTNKPGFHDTVIFVAKKPAEVVLDYYFKWLQENGYAPVYQPPEKPTAVYAESGDAKVSITATPHPDGTIVIISYAKSR